MGCGCGGACGCGGKCGCTSTSQAAVGPSLRSAGWCGDGLPEDGPARGTTRRGVMLRASALTNRHSAEHILPGVVLPISDGELAPGAWLSWLRQASTGGSGLLRARPAPPPAAGQGLPSGGAGGRTEVGEAKAWVKLGYGSASFHVDARWYRQYAADPSRWSTPDKVLAAIWPDYLAALAASGVPPTSFDRLIGCWDIAPDTSPSRYTFWQGGDGAPRELFRHMLGLLVAYRAMIRDGQSETELCAGFGEWIFDALQGEEVARPNGTRCRMMFNLRGDGATDGHIVDQGCGYPALDCSVDPRGATVAVPWDDYSPVWVEVDGAAYTYYYLLDTVSGSAAGTWDIIRPGTVAFGGKHRLNLPAVRLAWDALRADAALSVARVAVDYVRSGGADAGHLAAAYDAGRFVLGLALAYGHTLIHELGHTFLGGGHCTWGCCFDLAGHRFACGVKGTLGLSTNGSPCPSLGFVQFADDIEGPEACSTDGSGASCASDCGGDGVFACWNVRRCYTSRPGEPNPWFTAFYSTPCERTSAEAAAVFRDKTGIERKDPCAE